MCSEQETSWAPAAVSDNVELNVICPTSRKPVDLVEDDVVDVVRLDVAQHRLQLRTIGRAGALPSVNELLNDPSAEPVGLPMAGLALRWNGEALRLSPALGLISGRYAQVNHGLGIRCHRCVLDSLTRVHA